MKKVAIISPYSHGDFYSGAKVRAIELNEALKRSGNEVFLVAPWPEADLNFSLDCSVLARMAKILYVSFICFVKKYDIVFSECPFPLINLSGFCYYHVIHDTKFCTKYARRGKTLAFLGHKLCAFLSDRIITVSHTEAGKIERALGVKSNKIEVVYNGVSNQFLERKIENRAKKVFTFDFLYVSNFAPHKGHLNFLMACSKEFKIAFVGSNFGCLDEVTEYVKTRQLNVSFFSNLDTPALINLYDESRCFVFPSKLEGFGMGAIEAFSRGTPLLLNNIEVFHELAALTGAQIVDFTDIPKVQSVLSKVYDDNCIFECAKVLPSYFSWDEIVARMRI